MSAATSVHAQPADQIAFVAANVAAQPKDGKGSELQGIERKIAARDKAVCAAKSTPDIRDWVGTVRDNKTEDGIVRIRIAVGDTVEVGNWITPNDLPRPGNAKERAENAEQLAFVAMLAGVRRGDRVVFSGSLNTGYSKKCYGASNWLIRDRLDTPEYFIRFSRIAKL